MMKWYNVGGKILPMKTYKNGGKVLHLQQGGAAVSPTVNTGVPQGGYAAPAIQTYLAGNQAPQYSTGPIGAGVVGQPVNTNYVPPASTYVPPASTYVPPATTTNTGGGAGANNNYVTPATTTGNYGGNNTVYNTNLGGANGGLGFGAAGGVQNSVANAPGTLLNIPTWFQESNRVDQQVDDHGFTTEQVQDAASTLAGGTDLEGFTHQGQFEAASGIPGEVTSTAVDALGNEIAYDDIDWNSVNAPNIENTGGAATVQHDNLDALNAQYGAALSAIPNDGTATTEQRIAAAAANPAYNADAAANHSQVAAGVGNVGPLGFTKKAENLTTDDFNYVANQNFANNAYDKNIMNQYGLAGLSAAGAGIRNIGGANAQGGDNQGLPMEYMVLGDGTVYGPNGSEFSSVAEAQADAGVDAQQPAAQQGTWLDNLIGQFTDTGPTSKYGTAGSRTPAQQAAFDQFHSPGHDSSSITGQRGQIEGQQAAATKQANAYVNEQAQFNATATPEEQAANQQDQLLGDFLWKYEGADTPQMKAQYAEQAAAAGLDFGGQSPGDFIASDTVAGKDKTKLKQDAKAAKTAKTQGIKAVDGGFNTSKTTADTAAGTDVLWNGQTRAAVNAQHQAQANATGANADQSAGAQQAYQSNVQAADEKQFAESIQKFGLEDALSYANQSGSSADVQAVQQRLLAEGMAAGKSSQQVLEELKAGGTPAATASQLAPEQQSAAAQMLQAGVPAEVVLQTVSAAEPTPTPASNAPAHSPAVQDSLVENHGYTRQPDGSIRSPHFDILGYNTGGSVSLNQGGQPMTEEERMRQASAAKIARSQAQATPVRSQAPLQPQQVGKQGGGFGQMIGKKLLGAALGSIAGPLGPLLGGLFNEGGSVGGGKTISPTTRQLFDAKGNNIGQVPGDVIPGYNRESSGVGNQVDPFEGIAAKISADKAAGKPVDYAALAAVQHIRSIQNQAEKDKAMRAFMQKYPEFAVPGGSQGVVLRNQGGPISGNPQGYNEGGQTMATPIKKVMDMEKLESQKSMDSLKEEQAERAFQIGEKRKDEAHQQGMQQKAEAHQQAMKLKKESATMKAPLSK